jgi:type III restriction enzyme
MKPGFLTDPHAILDPMVRWTPAIEQHSEDGYNTLIPPLVHKIRLGVKAWRETGYVGASETSRALLRHWFETEHICHGNDGLYDFRYYFAQREAVESVIWLYEVEEAHDPYNMLKYDGSRRVSQAMFAQDWTRYVMKLATGSGKTKVMSLLIAWSYFHKRYEERSDLSTNFLLIAPNIIVLERLRKDFDKLAIFYDDPVVPENGYEGQNWKDDFQLSLHIQDELGAINESGNLFLTNIHRVFESDQDYSITDDDTSDYFFGPRPTGKTNASQIDLGVIVRQVPDLVVLNDEAHHVHDTDLAWSKSLLDISNNLRQKGSNLAVQLDFSATPKHNNGGIFVETICDYPLVEAIWQGIVKTPVLPDEESRAKLKERKSSKYTEMYRDHIHLGYLEWKKSFTELQKSGKKPILFIMTTDTKDCDAVGEYLQSTYPELEDKVLIIHTRNNGVISESASTQNQKELSWLREQSVAIDQPDNKYLAIVSVMVLREGWDVQSVTSIVGLRPFKAASKILPEQAVGRGLRLMFRGSGVKEKVSVIGTQAFIEFVESIKVEGVELEYAPMYDGSRGLSPLIIEVDKTNKRKQLDALDISLPVLSPRLTREYKNLEELNVAKFWFDPIPLKPFSEEGERIITFRHIVDDTKSHDTDLGTLAIEHPNHAIGYFATRLMRELHLVRGFDILFGKVKEFASTGLFGKPVDLEEKSVLFNLTEPLATSRIQDVFKEEINKLTICDAGSTRVISEVRYSESRPVVVDDQQFLVPKRSVFNKVVGNGLELRFAAFLDSAKDILSFVRNRQKDGFSVDYQDAKGDLRLYVPDFVIKEREDSIWIIETKGAEDIDAQLKFERLKQWCQDASTLTPGVTYQALFVEQKKFDADEPDTFADLVRMHRKYQ